MFSLQREIVLYYDFFVYVYRAAYDTSAPNAKRKYPDEGEADEEEIEEYKVREKGKSVFFFPQCSCVSGGHIKYMCV